jgi:cysteinyl-tRNA synthetase
MLKIFNSLGKKFEYFRPVNPDVVNIFTCGPSVYQRAHIGNFRTFLFEDVLVRYLQYSGYCVRRGMNITDIEDKALRAAHEKHSRLKDLTSRNIRTFISEMRTLKMEAPDYFPRASQHVADAVRIIEILLEKGIAYQWQDNIYFDPLKYPDFGKIYGLDMKKWPSKKIRFHLDNYPTTRWNFGDFILWHGCLQGERVFWDSAVGAGWPAWNVQDPSMIIPYMNESLSIYCGGVDNLICHHDYNAAILESVRPYPAAKYWLHCHHLTMNGKTMSKSTGNILYTDMLHAQGFTMEEIRFFLIYGHYRSRMNYSKRQMIKSVNRLRELRNRILLIRKKAKGKPGDDAGSAIRLRKIFTQKMDDDLDVAGAFDSIEMILNQIFPESLAPSEAASIMGTVRSIDRVLQVLL